MLKRSELNKYQYTYEYRCINEASERKFSSNLGKHFDIFICHTSKDYKEIMQLKAYFKIKENKEAYVDWIDDPELDRSDISEKTATRLQIRMQNSDKLYFVISKNSSVSKWMPWELGYFNGRKGKENILIYPIIDNEEEEVFNFIGQEYLKLYKIKGISTEYYTAMQLKYLLDKLSI